MTDAFNIDPVRCRSAHDNLIGFANRLRALLAAVDADNSVLIGGWEGDAREAFVNRQKRWHDDAETILAKLDSINAGLDQAVDIYVAADRQGAAKF
jgi:WXG100 family type VII secretion target